VKQPIIQDQQEAFNRSLKDLADIKFALDEATIVVVTDAQGVITYVNDTLCKISKYPREELLGQTHRIVNSGYHPKGFFQEMWKTIARGAVWKGEVKNRAKDGSYYWVDTTIVPFVDETTGKPYQYIAIRKDITYLKRIEEELRVLNEGLEERVRERTVELEASNSELSETLYRLQESEHLRETFVSALTHDLRTPLVAERRALELLSMQKHNLPTKLQSLADRLITNNDDLLALVNKLLEIYQYEAGKIQLILEPISLAAIVQECLDKLCPLAEAKQIILNNHISYTMEPIEADEDQFKRIIINLVENAIQHLSSEQQIDISATDLDDKVQLIVKDNGLGIPPEVLPHLFDRYFVVEQTRKKIGSGLGLSICKMIAKLHSGSIQVESTLGKGTTFYVTLPRQQEKKR
jgi:PAS domain S-box-containing protein